MTRWLSMSLEEFDEWSVKNAFTQKYFDREMSCAYCKTPSFNAHMCVYNSGEIVKIQTCPDGSKDLLYCLKYKNYVCKSCFIVCNPPVKFKRVIKRSISIIEKAMLKHFDKDFTKIFIGNVYEYIIKDNTLSCVPCSLKLEDYKWRTYRKLTSSYRKRRLEITP